MEKTQKYIVNRYKLEIVLRDKSINSGAKLVLLNLISRLGYKNFCFPSQQTIADNLGISARHVRNHITSLKNKGVIKIKRSAFNPRTQKQLNSNEYDLNSILQIKKDYGKKEI